MTRIIPSARAASVPGIGLTCQSARAAVRVSSGSITTVAPFLLARWMRGQRCGFVTTVFVPQRTMKRLWTMSLGSIPAVVPIVAATPLLPALPQIFRSSRVAPSRAKKRRSIPKAWIKPCVPM